MYKAEDMARAVGEVKAQPVTPRHLRQLADQMSAAWAAFARTGNPGNAKIPHWPAYSLKTRANMLFNARSRVVDDYGKEARMFWETQG